MNFNMSQAYVSTGIQKLIGKMVAQYQYQQVRWPPLTTPKPFGTKAANEPVTLATDEKPKAASGLMKCPGY